MQKYRIPNPKAQSQDVKHIHFLFNGKPYTGIQGDTIASALIANGVTLIGRSFKYHRPRGIVTAGSEEPNALVTLFSGSKAQPNMLATATPIYTGLEVYSQNAFPSVRYDLMAVNSMLSSVFVAGFYYKTFMGLGQKGWHFFEKFIRNAAGQGKADNAHGTETYGHTFDFCDVLIIGGGVAGLHSALVLAETGKRVILLDERERLGGYGLTDTSQIDGQDSTQWIKNALQTLKEKKNVTVLPRTTAFGLYDGNNVGAIERVSDHYNNTNPNIVRQVYHNITAENIILATGAIERPMVFANNDLPNVMQAESLDTYIRQYQVCGGDTIVIFTNNDSAYRTVNSLLEIGKKVIVIDARNVADNDIVQNAVSGGAVLYSNSFIHRVKGNALGVKVAQIISADGKVHTVRCDLVASSAGHTPVVHLWSHMFGKPVYNADICAFVPGEMPDSMYAIGAGNGCYDLQEILEQSFQVAMDICESFTKTTKNTSTVNIGDTKKPSQVTHTGVAFKNIQPASLICEVPNSLSGKGKKFIDMQHDVTSDDVALAHREGYQSVEHLKRYTTLGMANDQGKTSNINGLSKMADLRNKSIENTGTTVFRPPYTPVAIGSLAGVHTGEYVQPERFSPFHTVMLEYGAYNYTAGLWYRPQYFPKVINGIQESLQEGYIREMNHVRQKVGLCDVGTVGKIDVQGIDAAEFLNRLYANGFLKLPIGKSRYGLMLREDGIVDDDGTATRLGEHHFLVTTTTVMAGQVLYNMERYLQTQWQDLKVCVTSVTDQTGTLALAGPLSRSVLEKLVEKPESVGQAALPPLGMVYETIKGVDVRIVRLSFSGELAFEIFIESGYCEYIYKTIMQAGKEFDIAPYGMEALGGLRIEKGFITHAEINGTVSAAQVGMAGLQSKKKWFVGKDMIDREGISNPQYEMVGIIAISDTDTIRAGGHFVTEDFLCIDTDKQGYITSATFSPVCNKSIGLGLLKQGRSRIGQSIWVADPIRNAHYKVKIMDSVFYDKEGTKTNA